MDETALPNTKSGKIMNLNREASEKELLAAKTGKIKEQTPTDTQTRKKPDANSRGLLIVAIQASSEKAVLKVQEHIDKLLQGKTNLLSPKEAEERIQQMKDAATKDRARKGKEIIRLLPLKRCREYEIYLGYTMRIDKAQYARFEEDGFLDIETGLHYDIYHEEKKLCTLTITPTSGGHPDDSQVLSKVKEFFAKTHGFKYEETPDTVMRTIPPWERKEPVREIKNVTADNLKFSLNENGFAKRFEEECNGWLIFDTASNSWYAWNKTHWEPAGERLGQAQRFVADSMQKEVEYWKGEYAREEQIAIATKNNTRLKELKGLISALDTQYTQINQKHGFDSMVKIAQSSTMCINLDEEGNPDILTFKNGGLDCKTGRVLDVCELSYIKDMYPVHYVDRTYTKGAKPVHFEEHLRALFTDNTTDGLSDAERMKRSDELCRYFKRLLGYALYAGNPRNLFVFLWGTGANGKSTTVEALRSAIPTEFAEMSSMELLTTREEKPLAGLFDGVGKRVVYFAEISDSKDSKGPKISRESVKNLSGDKVKNLRTLYSKPVQKRILCLPIAATNDLPSFDKDLDKALLRRIITIPFMHEFVGSDKRLDMADVLASEADAIFSLMADELCAYAEAEEECPNSGLSELPEFCRGVQGKLLSGDACYEFVDSEFEVSDGSVSERVYADEARQRFIVWCNNRGISVQTKVMTSSVKDPATGVYGSFRDLTKTEASRLKSAFITHGYEMKSSSGKRYFCCKVKRG